MEGQKPNSKAPDRPDQPDLQARAQAQAPDRLELSLCGPRRHSPDAANYNNQTFSTVISFDALWSFNIKLSSFTNHHKAR